MKLVKALNIKGAVLDNYQLEKYLEQTASDHILKQKSDKDTYPIPRLDENFEYITKTYELLTKHLKLGIIVHPAGEWILDNYYIIEEAYKSIKKDLSLKKYTNFLAIANGEYKGYARIYILAAEIVAYTDGNIEEKNLENLLRAYQTKKTLNMEEIWNIGVFFQIAIIEKIRGICEKIYSSQMQKLKVENMIERLIEKKEKEKQIYKINNKENKIRVSIETKYPFIEHLSYRLKQYGKIAIAYTNVLDEQVYKMGTTVSEIIKKEHFDIALRKVSMGNCIKSIKEIQRMNVLEIFEKINGVEELLKEDPAGVYINMDFKTKEHYREQIKEISEKTKISEIYIARKVLELAKKNVKSPDKRLSHIGYYLIDDGIWELAEKLQIKNKDKICNFKKQNLNEYIFGIYIITFLISCLVSKTIFNQTSNIVISIISLILIFIPVSEIVTKVIQYILGKIVKPKNIPKMNYLEGIPENSTTMVVIPTIINSVEKAKELSKKLEVFYIANKSDNLYFTLLGDASTQKKLELKEDDEIYNVAKEEIKKLNEKYKVDKMPIFNYMQRQRSFNEKEEIYLGWERKRGMLYQFNEYIEKIINRKEDYIKFQRGLDFKINTIDEWIKQNNKNDLPKKIKYIITLDADTDLVLNSGLELVGAMCHILNKPILDKEEKVVIKGHGLMQPRVGIHLEASRKSKFSKLFGGLGGTDSYTNAISDTYQDNFEEGIFTGKGIYDLEVFNKVLKNAIPENTVLSHDLLEGNYLRCALVTDILLMDGYPYKYNSFISRLHRWIRGDWQIISWLKSKVKNIDGKVINNPLNKLSKYKIFDNLRRSLIEIFACLNLIFASLLKIYNSNIKVYPLVLVSIISITISSILEILNHIVYKKEGEYRQKTFENNIGNVWASIIRAILYVSTLPHKAYTSLDAIIRTIYRMVFTKKKMLEWTTSEEAEMKAKTNVASYYMQMFTNIIFVIASLILIFVLDNTFCKVILGIFAVIWAIAPLTMCKLSKPINKKDKKLELKKEEQEYVLEIGKRTWNFFKEYMNEENNYLPPDNYQDNRKEKVVDRTSSTNIGLGLLCIISAFDLGFIQKEEALNFLYKMLETIDNMPKWNGHLYNWYKIKTMEPLIPRFISTVDSGNFIGYLYTVKQFLIEVNEEKYEEKILNMIQTIDKIIDNTDFKILYDNQKRIFSIGFNVEENKLTNSYYDLLASEARQASLIAIAKKDVSPKHWNSLSRTLTVLDKYKGLISWSGTAFEYLMPNINITNYEGSLLDESSKFLIMSQQKYAKKLGIPWGISESAFNLKDLIGNYQYKAFGIPWLGLKRGLGDEMVVAPYGSILAITEKPKDVVNNLKELEKQGMFDKYGFYEAIDYTPSRVKMGKIGEPVRTYMAHHQALILLSINNLFNKKILQKRFMQNPEIRAVDILLQERMPENVVMTKEKKEKVEKIKYTGYNSYSERTITKINPRLNYTNVISNNNYTVGINEKGYGFSKIKDVMVNRYKNTADYPQGIIFYIKNIKSKKIWTNGIDKNVSNPDKYSISYTQDMDKITRQDGNIETISKVIIAEENVEIRQIELKNNGSEEEILEVTSCFEPVLSNKEQDYSHTAFNNLFLKYDIMEDSNSILIKRNKRGNQNEMYLACNLYIEGEKIGELEYEIDKEKLYENGGMLIPKMIEESKPFSKQIGLVTNPIIALKQTVKVKPDESIKLNLVIAVGEQKENLEENMIKYRNHENVKRALELSKARVEEETRYLGITAKETENYQKLLSYLIFNNPTKFLYLKNFNKKTYNQSDLWKYGISGDIPILLVKIQEIEEIFILDDILKAYEYYRAKNINIDLVIMIKEENIYEQYVKQNIESQIANHNLSYVQNVYGGIYIINEREIEDIDLFLLTASCILDTKKGNLETILEDTMQEYLDSIKNIGKEKNTLIPLPKFENNFAPIDMEKLKYYNEYGGFSEDGKEYIIKQNKNMKPPTVWSNIMANKKFGTLVTNNLGGFTWSKNSRLNRITAWSNNLIEDIPSEIIYIKDKDISKTWSLGVNPICDENDYYITFGFGYTKYEHSCFGIVQKQEIFVPKDDSVKCNIITLKNNMPNKRNLKLVYYIKPVLGEDEYKTNNYINLTYNENTNCIFANNLYGNGIAKTVYISSSEKISSYTGNKDEFIGDGNILSPEGMDKVYLSGENSLGRNSCIAICFEIEIESYGTKEIVINLGEEDKKIDAENMAYKYSKINNAKDELENVKRFWNEILSRVQVKTQVESTNILLNGWIAYQTIVCRLWGKSAFYQSGGAYGFRDQLQDTMGVKFISPEFMKNQILIHARHQFKEGDVEHWWHEETKRGIRTRFSDDLLWLVYVTIEYIEFTGDETILELNEPYIQGEILQNDEDEKYDEHIQANETASIYEHCIRALEKSLVFGENGLPKIGSGDWNDGMNTVGNKGKGESVWLGFFLYYILDKFIPICKKRNDVDKASKYEQIKIDLKKALNTNAWDGRWYKRAFSDNGDVLGSIENDECRIDSISQSWSVISNAGDNDKKYIAMESLENHLIDTKNGIIKLLDPPFEKGKIEPGYIKSYLPGVRENGGQYTHAAIWTIIALAKLGFGDKAFEYFRMINPIEHARTKEESYKYKVEPYVIAADVYGASNLQGRGGWTWYTGSSSWMYKAGIENILGLKIQNGYLEIQPCIPKNWKEYEIKYKYEDTLYKIIVKNPNGKNVGVEKIKLNGEEIIDKKIKLINDFNTKDIEVEM